ncbi:flavin reductase [Halobellus sp. Atlit-31R]|nr:flavin reductase [Halobellus sp. Atlit-31R]
MTLSDEADLFALQPDQPFFETVYTASPLVIVGTREPDGSGDLAPKHMAIPLGWADYFGFVCTPAHATYQNAERTGSFTVSYPRPENVLEATLAAGPRDDEGHKPSLAGVETVEADAIDAPAVKDAYAVLECEVTEIVDGFGENALVAGEIVGKYVHSDAYRDDDAEPEALLERAPALAYLYPDRFASVSETQSFPFPEGFER